MRKVLMTVGALLLAAVAGAQVKVTTQGSDPKALQIVAASAPLDSAKRISREDAMELFRKNKAVYVDVRSKQSYDAGHIKGALSIPGSQLIARLREIPPGRMAITYCACEKEHTAAQAVLNLNAHRVKNAAALIGGWNEWAALGLPTEVTK